MSRADAPPPDPDAGGPEGYTVSLSPHSGTAISWSARRNDGLPLNPGVAHVEGQFGVTLDPASAQRPVAVDWIDGWHPRKAQALLTTDQVAEVVRVLEARDPSELSQLLADGPAAELAERRRTIPGLVAAVTRAVTNYRDLLSGDLSALLFSDRSDPHVHTAVNVAAAARFSFTDMLATVPGLAHPPVQLPRVFQAHRALQDPWLWITAIRTEDGNGVYAAGRSTGFDFSPDSPNVLTGPLSEVGHSNPADSTARAALLARTHECLAAMTAEANLRAEDNPDRHMSSPHPIDIQEVLRRWGQVCGPPLTVQLGDLHEAEQWWAQLLSIPT
jgi:hypothetical protein